jgi:S-adenosylhomocysteine hydrolase
MIFCTLVCCLKKPEGKSLITEIEKIRKYSLKPGMIDVPEDIDNRVGFLKLQSMGIEIDTLTEE